MRVAGVRQQSGPVETLDLADPRPLADDEVLIEVRAAGVANWDEFVRIGQWDVGRTPPMALGVAGAGVVASTGAGVRNWKAGDQVLSHPLPLRDQGTWAPLLIAQAALLARKPPPVSWEVAAVFPVPALTAQQVLDEALQVKTGETLLVSGGGGVTGRLLVGLGAARGLEVIATAGAANHSIGSRFSLDGAGEALAAAVRGRGGDAVVLGL